MAAFVLSLLTDAQRTEPDNVQAAALMLIATLVERCTLWSDLRRRVTASGGEAARLVTALLVRLEAPAALKSEILVFSFFKKMFDFFGLLFFG